MVASESPYSGAGKRWSPAGLVFAVSGIGATCITVGAALGPLFMKPDLTGYVKEDRLKACETRLDERQKQQDDAANELRRQVGRCYQLLGDCKSQDGANRAVIESMEKRRR